MFEYAVPAKLKEMLISFAKLQTSLLQDHDYQLHLHTLETNSIICIH
jgi:hypothetical protein